MKWTYCTFTQSIWKRFWKNATLTCRAYAVLGKLGTWARFNCSASPTVSPAGLTQGPLTPRGAFLLISWGCFLGSLATSFQLLPMLFLSSCICLQPRTCCHPILAQSASPPPPKCYPRWLNCEYKVKRLDLKFSLPYDHISTMQKGWWCLIQNIIQWV